MANPMQPDHMEEDTRCLLVRGWKIHVSFDDMEAQLDTLQAAIDGTDFVFVVAQSLVYAEGGKHDVVIGVPLLSVHANDGPIPWSVASARAVEATVPAELPETIRAKLESLAEAPPLGAAEWLLVPTGALASGYSAHGELVDNPKYDQRGDDIVSGCDMNQDSHKKAVKGTQVVSAMDWDIQVVDMNQCAELESGGGTLFLITRYD